MIITRIYTGDDGETHFEDVELDLHPDRVHMLTDGVPASEIIFRETPADAFNDFHKPTRRQYTINLEGTTLLDDVYSEETANKLEAMGFPTERATGASYFGSAKMMEILPNGVMAGAADGRREANAVGF